MQECTGELDAYQRQGPDDDDLSRTGHGPSWGK